jgi:hypothetical protein
MAPRFTKLMRELQDLCGFHRENVSDASAAESRTPPAHRVVAARSRIRSVAVGIAIGFIVAVIVYYRVSRSTDEPGGDFWQHWAAARYLLSGVDPYAAITPSTLRVAGDANTAFGNWYFYPLPAAALGLPFVWASPAFAASLFAGLAAGLFAMVMDRRKALALCLSTSLLSTQATPLLVAATFIPAFQWLLVVKPNIGLALFAYRPSRWAVIGGLVACALALVLVPAWPREWLAIIRRSPHHHAPVTLWYGGPLLLAALLKWRRREARLLVVMACVPQVLLFYDQLPLALIADSERERLTFVWLNVAASIGFLLVSGSRHGALVVDVREAAPWVLWCVYIPCLLMVMRRPNVGEDCQLSAGRRFSSNTSGG